MMVATTSRIMTTIHHDDRSFSRNSNMNAAIKDGGAKKSNLFRTLRGKRTDIITISTSIAARVSIEGNNADSCIGFSPRISLFAVVMLSIVELSYKPVRRLSVTCSTFSRSTCFWVSLSKVVASSVSILIGSLLFVDNSSFMYLPFPLPDLYPDE